MRREYLLISIISNLILLSAVAGFVLIFAPFSPLPTAYNPTKPLDVEDPINFVTRGKLALIQDDPIICRAYLDQLGVGYEAREDFEANENCGIGQRTLLTSLGDVEISATEMNCQVALRMALWEKHALRPAAQSIGKRLDKLVSQGSYNCRTINSGVTETTTFSRHATAEAIDISGFIFEDGETFLIEEDWRAGASEAKAFLRQAHSAGCQIFSVGLGPDYNHLHEDHFHFDVGDERACY